MATVAVILCLLVVLWVYRQRQHKPEVVVMEPGFTPPRFGSTHDDSLRGSAAPTYLEPSAVLPIVEPDGPMYAAETMPGYADVDPDEDPTPLDAPEEQAFYEIASRLNLNLPCAMYDLAGNPDLGAEPMYAEAAAAPKPAVYDSAVVDGDITYSDIGVIPGEMRRASPDDGVVYSAVDVKKTVM